MTLSVATVTSSSCSAGCFTAVHCPSTLRAVSRRMDTQRPLWRGRAASGEPRHVAAPFKTPSTAAVSFFSSSATPPAAPLVGEIRRSRVGSAQLLLSAAPPCPCVSFAPACITSRRRNQPRASLLPPRSAMAAATTSTWPGRSGEPRSLLSLALCFSCGHDAHWPRRIICFITGAAGSCSPAVLAHRRHGCHCALACLLRL